VQCNCLVPSTTYIQSRIPEWHRGHYPEFIEHFHKLLARSQNVLRGRWENFCASEQTWVVKLVDREAVIAKLIYTAANPVQDHLVERVHHWPGPHTTPSRAARASTASSWVLQGATSSPR
jgi:hypothetical protein